MDKKISVLLSIQIPFQNVCLKGDVYSSQAPSLLFLHGAGKLTSRQCFHALRLALDIPSVAFDFIGHGESGGVLENSSLEDRLQQACAVIDACKMQKPLSIVASSMSGYTAVKLLEKYEVANLILLVPAIYDARANDKPFNEGFTEIIRSHESWRKSDAWDILERFEGNLLLLCAEEDAVIPKEIPRLIYDTARRAKKKEIHTISKSPHRVLKFLSENPEEYASVLHILSRFIKSCL